MSKFNKEVYEELCKKMWDELQEEVKRGEISKADASFQYRMYIDDLLYQMEEDDE